jgi:hypothetical protein
MSEIFKVTEHGVQHSISADEGKLETHKGIYSTVPYVLSLIGRRKGRERKRKGSVPS